MNFKDFVKNVRARAFQVGPCPGGFHYVIKAGDTLYSLAKTYNTTVDAIIAANPGINPDALQIGQRICIPGTRPPKKCLHGIEYTIKAGDTYGNLAVQYNTTVRAIMRANPGVDPNNLQIGQVICIPTRMPPSPPVECPNGTTYTIKAGDTLYSLAKTYNTTVDAIIAANPGINPDALQIGQVICIPSVTPPTVECPGGTLYTIKAGDTLYSLAQTYNTTVNAIITANPGLDPNSLQVGRIICIPAAS